MKKVLFIAALAISATGFSQKVGNKVSFPKGGKLEVVTELKKTGSIELMGNAMESSAATTVTEVYDVEAASEGGATIEHKVKRLVSSIETRGQKQTFDSEKEEDRNGEIGKILEKSLKNKYKMTVDASGRITSVKADDDNPNGKADKDADAMAAAVSGQLGFEGTLPKTGDATLFAILPANRQVAQGDTWTETATKEGVKKTTTYKVSSITATDIILDFTEVAETNTTQNMMGVDATIKNTDNATGQITLDRKTGLLKQKTATIESKGTIEAQGMTIPQTGKTSLTTTVKGA